MTSQPVQAVGTVTGTITEPDGSTSVANANLTLRTANWTSSTYFTTGSDGAFSFANIAAGSYYLEVWTNNATYFSPDKVSLTVTDGQTTALGAVRLLAANFFCKVTKVDGTTAVANANVTIRTSDWSLSRNTSTDSSGNCRQAFTTQTSYIIEVSTQDSTESRPDPITVTYSGAAIYEDGTNGSSVIRQTAASVRGKLVLPDGTTAAQSVNLSLYDSNNFNQQSASTDSAGLFKLDSVATGTYTLRISQPSSPAGLAPPDPVTLALTKGTTNTTYLSSPLALTNAVKTITGRVTRTSGNAITDATVSAWLRMGNGSSPTTATVNSSGQYSLTVGSAGTWQLSVAPSSSGGTVDWAYNGTPKTAIFSLPNAQAESATVNFSVPTLSVTLRGTVRLPSGVPLTSGPGVNVNVWSDAGGSSNSSQLASDGSYQMKVAPGTYHLSFMGSSDYGAPEITLSVKENETVTKDITLLERNATITGTVRDRNGQAVANQSCNAWLKGGSGWGWANTTTSGSYSMPVTAGTWHVSCYPNMSGPNMMNATNYVLTDPPQEVTVAAHGTAAANFTFDIADATITGKVVDQAGVSLTSLNGWIDAVKCTGTSSTFNYHGLGANLNGGSFTLHVPGGCWKLGASVGYGGDYSASSSSVKDVTVTSGGTVNNVELKLVPNNATVSGSIKDANGAVLTDVSGSVFLTNGLSYQWAQIESGLYSVKVAAGAWDFGCWVDPTASAQYYLRGVCEGTVSATADATTTRDVTLLKADAVLNVRTLDPNGNPLSNARVVASASFGEVRTVSYDTYGGWFNPDKTTDQNGRATFYVPSGATLFVSASLPQQLGYMNPNRVVVTARADEATNVTLDFRRSDATIAGTVSHGAGAYTGGAIVSGWSADGGFSETSVASDGTYTLPVTKGDDWIIRSGADDSATTGFESQEKTVSVPDSGSASANLALDTTTTLPEATTTTVNSNSQQTVTVEGGPTITFPANSLATNSASVVLAITPTVEQAPNVATDAHVGLVYDVTANVASGANAGSPITQLPGTVTIAMPYTDAELSALGIQESALTAKKWDDTADTYVDVQSVVVDTSANIVYLTTNHLTKFAITSAPTEQSASPGNSGPAPVVTPNLVELKTRALAVLTAGPDPRIILYNPSGRITKRIRPYAAMTNGTFHLLAADVVGDNAEELVVYEEHGRAPLKIYSLAGRALGQATLESGATLSVVSGDLNADGKDELIVGSGKNRTVTVYSFLKKKLAQRLSFKGPDGAKGVEVLAGNVTANKADELVIMPRGGNTITVYRVDLGKKKVRALGAAALALRPSGERVVLADTTGDEHVEMIVWPAAGSKTISILTVRPGKFKTVATATVNNPLALAVGDITGDGKADIVTITTAGQKVSVKLLSFKKKVVNVEVFSGALGSGPIVDPDLAIGDFDADGKADVVLSQANSTRVMTFSYQPGVKKLKLITTKYVGGKTSTYGYTVTATDLNADGRSEIVLVPTGQAATLRLVRFNSGKLTLSKNLTPSGQNYRGTFAVTVVSTH